MPQGDGQTLREFAASAPRWLPLALGGRGEVVSLAQGSAVRRSLLPAGDALDGRGQVVVAGLDVAAGGLQRLVAHQVGDDLDGGAGVGQVLAEGVPQDVGGAFLQLGQVAVLGQGGLEAADRQGPALAV